MKRSIHPLAQAIRLSILLLALPAIGLAQDDAAEAEQRANQLDSVEVSARKVNENLQDVPLSISAIGEDKIETLGLDSINDIARITPGFSFRSAFGREGDRPVVRGQSNIQGEANAAFYIDGVFVNGNISGYQLDNLSRVEVIRGPQSALFGRRSFAGAINFITKRPTNQAEGKVSLSAASDSEREFNANISGSLVDDLLLFQANARFYGFGGQYLNTLSNVKDFGGQKTGSAGGSLYFTPTDNFTSTFRFNYTEDQDEHYPIFRQGSGLNNCFLPSLTGAVVTGFPVARTRTRGYFCGTPQVREAFPMNIAEFDAAGFPAGLERERMRLSMANDLALENGWSLSSISAYNTFEGFSNVDQDFSGLRGFGGAFETIDFGKSKDYSQEFRITSAQDQPIRGLAGVYWYKESPGTGGFTGSLSGVSFLPNGQLNRLPTTVPVVGGVTTTNQAVFGMIEWDLTDALTLTGELRYGKDKIRLGGRSTATVRPIGTPTTTPLQTRSFNLSKNFDSTLPRVTAKYTFTDDLNVYFLAALGNKPGGFNSSVQSANLTEPGRNDLITRGFQEFEEEEAWTYEIGAKSRWLDGAVTLNAALFFIDWDQQQLTQTAVTPRLDGSFFVTSYTDNLGQSRVQGLELDGSWQISDHLNMFANYTYQDAEIRSYCSPDLFDLFGSCDASGKTLPRVPKSKATVGGVLSDSFSNGWAWFVAGDATYEGSRFGQIENLNETGSSTLVNLRAGLDFDANWSVQAFVRNATDDDTPEDILRYVNPASFIRVPSIELDGTLSTTRTDAVNVRDFAITAPRQRQYGVSLTYRF